MNSISENCISRHLRNNYNLRKDQYLFPGSWVQLPQSVCGKWFFQLSFCSTNDSYIPINPTELLMMLTNFEVIHTYVKICNTTYVYMPFHCLVIALLPSPHSQRLIAHNIFSESNKRKKSQALLWLPSQRSLLLRNNSL